MLSDNVPDRGGISPYLFGVDSLSVSKRGEVADMDRIRLVCHDGRPGIDAQSVGSGTGFPFEKMVGRDILGRGILRRGILRRGMLGRGILGRGIRGPW